MGFRNAGILGKRPVANPLRKRSFAHRQLICTSKTNHKWKE